MCVCVCTRALVHRFIRRPSLGDVSDEDDMADIQAPPSSPAFDDDLMRWFEDLNTNNASLFLLSANSGPASKTFVVNIFMVPRPKLA